MSGIVAGIGAAVPENKGEAPPDSAGPRARRLKVGLVVPSLENSGGVQSIMDALAKRIDASPHHEALIISLATSASDRCSVRLRKPSTWLRGVEVEERTWRGRRMLHVGCNLVEFEFMRYRSRTVLKDLLSGCDVVQVVGGFPAWAVAVSGCGKPVSIWAATRSVWERRRSNAATGAVAAWRKLMTRLSDGFDARAVRGTDRVMVMNPLMDYYARTLRTDPGGVISAPPGIDCDYFKPASARPGPSPYVLSVGRFSDPRKNPELLLEAIAILKARGGTFPRLILAGSSRPLAGFWSRAAALGLTQDVEFREKPDADALLRLYQQALCYALPSDEEGFGMVLIEAMACGVPVVATRCGGPDGILTDGQDGFLVAPGDAKAMADRLAQLCGDKELNLRLGVAARRTVEMRYSEKTMGEIFFRTWEEMVDLSARRRR